MFRFLTSNLVVGRMDPLYRHQGVIDSLSSYHPAPAPSTPPTNKSNRQTSRYGHTCLLTEVAGTRGIMVAGGALAGKQVAVIAMMMMMMIVRALSVTLTIVSGI